MGDAIFGGLLDRCNINPLNPSRQQDIKSGLSFLQTVSNIDDIALIAFRPVRLCFCIVGKPDCSFKPLPIHVKKGEAFKLSFVAVDQVNHTLEAVISAFLSSNDGGFREGQQQQTVGTNCTDLTYNSMTVKSS